VGVTAVWFDPRTGESAPAPPTDGDFGDRWKVICEGDGVSILGERGGSTHLIGAGRWTGNGIARRYAVADPISDRMWSHIENAMRRVMGAASGPAVIDDDERPGLSSTAVYHEAMVDLTTGDVREHRRSPSMRRPANAFEWKLVIEDDKVTLYATDDRAFARARWDGEQLIDRELTSSPIQPNDYQWSVIASGVSQLLTGRPLPVATFDSPVRVPKRGRDVTPVASRTTDRRSGWWALGAFLIALVGMIVTIATRSPGDNGLVTGIAIGLGAGTLGLGIYNLIGISTRCPRCRAWFRRETRSIDHMGSHTKSKTIDEPIYDSDGKQTGSRSVHATYEVSEYRYNYRCKECSNTWSRHSTSEHRVS